MPEEGTEVEFPLTTVTRERIIERGEGDLYEHYFEDKRPQLVKTFQAAYQTSYGQEVLEPLGIEIHKGISYKEFSLKVPLVRSKQVGEDSKRFTRGITEEMYHVFSTGTTGRPKEFYLPRSEFRIQFPEDFTKIIQESKNPVLLHRSWSVDYKIIEESLQAIRPDIGLEYYNDANGVLESVKRADTIYLITEVTPFRVLMYQIKNLLEEDPSLIKQLKGKQLFIEIGSEPVSFQELQTWFTYLKEVIGDEPDFVVTYGQNDTGIIGTYRYKDGDTEEDFKYRVANNRLIEVLDSTGNLVFGQRGNIISTTFRNEGSILVRYLTGDQGVLSIDNEGKIYLSAIGRNPEDGMLIFAGMKLSISGFSDSLREKLDIPFQLEAQVIEDPDNLFNILNVTLYSDEFLDPVKANFVKGDVFSKLMGYTNLTVLIGRGNLKINVNVSSQQPEDFTKGWRILPKQTV